MFYELHLDEGNKLSGTVQTYLTWKRDQAGNADIITKLVDENGNQITKFNVLLVLFFFRAYVLVNQTVMLSCLHTILML